MQKLTDEELIQELKQIGQTISPDEDFVIRSKWNIEREIRMVKEEKNPRFIFRPALLFAVIMLFFILGIKEAYVLADDSRPGDFLYPLDLFSEKIQLLTALSEEKKSQFRQEIALERVSELDSLLEITDEETKQDEILIPTPTVEPLPTLNQYQHKAWQETKKALEEAPQGNTIIEQNQGVFDKLENNYQNSEQDKNKLRQMEKKGR